MNGGLRAGDLISIVGRPGRGKTYQLLARCHHIWQTQKKVILFVSMEMNAEQIFERLAAIHTKTKFDWIKFGSFPNFPKDLKKVFADKLMALEAPDLPGFYVVDGNITATVEDICALAQQLGPDLTGVDGAYMVQHPDKKLNRYAKVAENANLLKSRLAQGLKMPVIATWQFARSGEDIKKGEIPGLEHIAHSDEIGQLSSVVLGMFDPDDTPESKIRRMIHVLKGRSGEVGSFATNWDFNVMNFEEADQSPQMLEVL